MVLSNRPTLLAFTCIIAFLLLSCGSEPGGSDKGQTVSPGSRSGFPFSTIEPEIFQGDFVITSDGVEKKWFFARSGRNWRFDIFATGGNKTFTQLRTDKVYLIDHVQKTYAAQPDGNGLINAPDQLLSGFFRAREFYKFEDLGGDGDIHKYKIAASESAKDDVVIFIDKASGVIVRQEFFNGTGSEARLVYLYEVRDLKLSVDDNVFDLPAGYRSVEVDEFQRSRSLELSGP